MTREKLPFDDFNKLRESALKKAELMHVIPRTIAGAVVVFAVLWLVSNVLPLHRDRFFSASPSDNLMLAQSIKDSLHSPTRAWIRFGSFSGEAGEAEVFLKQARLDSETCRSIAEVLGEPRFITSEDGTTWWTYVLPTEYEYRLVSAGFDDGGILQKVCATSPSDFSIALPPEKPPVLPQ